MIDEQKEAAERVLAFVSRRWGELAAGSDTVGAAIRKAAKVRGLTIPLADYLETLARRHEMFARAFRVAARAARGEDITTLIDVDIATDPERRS